MISVTQICWCCKINQDQSPTSIFSAAAKTTGEDSPSLQLNPSGRCPSGEVSFHNPLLLPPVSQCLTAYQPQIPIYCHKTQLSQAQCSPLIFLPWGCFLGAVFPSLHTLWSNYPFPYSPLTPTCQPHLRLLHWLLLLVSSKPNHAKPAAAPSSLRASAGHQLVSLLTTDLSSVRLSGSPLKNFRCILKAEKKKKKRGTDFIC